MTLIIRTFLFVTDSGTPKGKRLHQICGLGRLYGEILAINKLSTSAATDIKNDKELDSLFLEASCGCLLEPRDSVTGFNTKEGMASAMPMLKKYFGLKRRQDFMMPDPLDNVRRRFERKMGR